MMKKFFAFVTLIVCLNFTVAFAANENYDNYADYAEDIPLSVENPVSIVDTLHLLKTNEVSTLSKKIQQIEQKHKVRIGIEFLKNTHGQSIVDTANSLLDRNFIGEPNGGILLLVVMDSRKWRIATDSAMRSRISDLATEEIASSFVDKLTDGDYYGACNSYIDGVDKCLTYYETNGVPYDPSQGIDSSVLIVSIITAIIFGILFRTVLVSSMSNVQQATTAGEYLKRDSVQITDKNDTYLFTNVSRRRKSKSRSSGGSSGRGGGGGHGGSGGSF